MSTQSDSNIAIDDFTFSNPAEDTTNVLEIRPNKPGAGSIATTKLYESSSTTESYYQDKLSPGSETHTQDNTLLGSENDMEKEPTNRKAEEIRKKKKIEKMKTRRMHQREMRGSIKTSANHSGVNQNHLRGVSENKRDIEMDHQENRNKAIAWNGANNMKTQSMRAKAKSEQMTAHNVEVAATGQFGYIALDQNFLEKGKMADWVDGTILALADSGRPAESVSYLSEPSANTTELKKKSMIPALQLCFGTEEDLEKALGPITILGFETVLERYRGGKGCIFKIRLGTWGRQEQKIKEAFEMQAMAEVKAWGWRHLRGMKTDLIIQTVKPPGRVVDTIQIDGWWLTCLREKERFCCCCEQEHSCFELDAGCGNFELGNDGL